MVCHKLPNDKEVRKYKENHQIRQAKSALSKFFLVINFGVWSHFMQKKILKLSSLVPFCSISLFFVKDIAGVCSY